MPALTLLEASKGMTVGPQRAALQIYASSYHVLQQLGFVPAEPGGTLHWTVEDTLGTATGRAIGEDFTPDNGTESPKVAVSAIYGGKVQVDRAIRKTLPGSIASKKANKIKGFARQFAVDVFEAQGAKKMRGISNWVGTEPGYTGQVVDFSSATPTMAKMDELYDKVNVVPGKSFFYMNQAPFLKLNTLSRTNGTGQQNIVYSKDDFGTRLPYYNDVPIIVMKDGKGLDLLSNVETAGATPVHTGGALTSIYAVTYGDEMFTGFENGGMDFIDDSDATNFENFTMEHICGVAPKIVRSVARGHSVALA